MIVRLRLAGARHHPQAAGHAKVQDSGSGAGLQQHPGRAHVAHGLVGGHGPAGEVGSGLAHVAEDIRRRVTPISAAVRRPETMSSRSDSDSDAARFWVRRCRPAGLKKRPITDSLCARISAVFSALTRRWPLVFFLTR